MNKSSREVVKHSRGITPTLESKCCEKCLFRVQKICQIHMLKTNKDEICTHFKHQRKHAIVNGGSVSPR